MEERELTQLLQQVGDRVTPGPPPLRRIVDDGEALRGRRSGRMRTFAVAAAAAAVIGGGSVAAVVLELPSGADEAADSAAGQAYDDGGAGGGEESGPQAGGGGEGGSDRGTADAAAVPVVVTPDAAGPGDRVEVAVPSDVAFGVEWFLERSSGAGWDRVFVLVDAEFAAENGVQLSRPADSSEALAEVYRSETGPVTLLLPDTATPGKYRICQTVDDGTDWCGALTVTD